MQGSHCLNCGTTLTSEQKFCPACGQKSDTKRISFPQLLRDLLLFITHAETGILNLIKGLAIHPGRTAAEYADGKRKTYFNPFTFLALCIALMVFINHRIHPYSEVQLPDPVVMARIPDEVTKQAYLQSIKRMNDVQEFTNKNLNLFSVAISPYFAFGLWLFFRRRRRNAAEITVAYILFSGFSNVVFSILVSPLMSVSHNANARNIIFWIGIFLENFYFAWGFKTFFGFKSFAGYLQIVGALVLIGIVGLLLLLIFLFFYVYHGRLY